MMPTLKSLHSAVAFEPVIKTDAINIHIDVPKINIQFFLIFGLNIDGLS